MTYLSFHLTAKRPTPTKPDDPVEVMKSGGSQSEARSKTLGVGIQKGKVIEKRQDSYQIQTQLSQTLLKTQLSDPFNSEMES